MKTNIMRLMVAAAICAFCAGKCAAQQVPEFRTLVGNVTVGPVSQTSPMSVPFITWGGDMATFYANGGLRTQPGSIFARAGFDIQLEAGDDFIQQVRNYMSGKTPFLRGTFRMIGMASGVLASDPRTQGVVIMQMTWSAGDHMVGRSTFEKMSQNDLAGKNIVLQRGGPHVGMLDDLLREVDLKWSDINVIWAKDLTATDDSPAKLFAKRPDIDACFVITPDMLALTGAIDKVGSGLGGTVKGAHVVASTAYRRGSIADVYVCRKDFFDRNRDLVTKFVNGYLRACEEVGQIKTGNKVKYNDLLKLTQSIYGNEVIPTIAEADGLLADCEFVLYPGNVEFFTWKHALSFTRFVDKSLGMAVNLGYISARPNLPLIAAWDNYDMSAIKSGLANQKESREMPVIELDEDKLRTVGKDRTLVSFSVKFEPNQRAFPVSLYGKYFANVLDMAESYLGAAFIIRGHADPRLAIDQLFRVGGAKGLIEKRGKTGAWEYWYQGKRLDQTNIAAMISLIESGQFSGSGIKDDDGIPIDPMQTVQACLNLSQLRAESVRQAIIDYAKEQNRPLPEKQLLPVGVGIAEPINPYATTIEEVRANMRVEFRLVRVTAEITGVAK